MGVAVGGVIGTEGDPQGIDDLGAVGKADVAGDGQGPSFGQRPELGQGGQELLLQQLAFDVVGKGLPKEAQEDQRAIHEG